MSLSDFLVRRFGFRLRVFLFFLLAALASVVMIGMAAYFAVNAAPSPERTFVVRAGVVAAFGVFAVIMAVWLQFDTHVGRPIERLGRFARMAAHTKDLDAGAALPDAPYLGYLAPAVADLTAALENARHHQDAAVRAATERAERQKARLEAVLHDLGDGILICNLEHEVLFYNPSAVDILHGIGTIGLRRSVFEVLAPEPVRHNLARLEGRVRAGHHRSAADGLSLPFAALCVDGRTTIEAVMTLTLASGAATPQGYILFFSDETELLAASAEAERQLIALAESIREHAGSLRLLGDLLSAADSSPERVRELTVSILEEVASLTGSSTRLDNLAMDHLSRAWPMAPVMASTLFDLVKERVRVQQMPETLADPHTAILCDSAAIAALLARLCEWVADRGGEDICLEAAIGQDGGFLDVSWQGASIPVRELSAWLAPALDHDLGPVTAADVLARHATDIWSEAVAGETRKARLRLPLQMRDMSRLPKPLVRIPERAAVYDFDIFEERLPADLAQTPLNRLTAVVFDTETTGLEPSRGDRMVSVAGIRIVNGRIIEAESFDELVNPGRPIPPSSTAIHGITDAMVAGAPAVEDVVRRFAVFCDGAVLVAHNAPFDMRFLAIAAAGAELDFGVAVLDTVLLAAHLHGAEEDLTLDRLAEIHGVRISDEARHTAMGDAIAAARIFIAMLEPLAAAGIRTLGDAVRISEAQAALRRKQAKY